MLRVTEYIAYNMNRGFYTAAAFLDIEKTYDKVWLAKLICKLKQLNVLPTYLVRLLAGFLSDRRFFVQIDNQRSSTKQVAKGIPRGSVCHKCE